jgi:hypothetical protein
MKLSTVMAIQTARITLMNLTVVRCFIKIHIVNEEMQLSWLLLH